MEILTKMKPLPQYEYIIQEKQENHEEMMMRNQEEDNWLLDILFHHKVIKRIKDKNKKKFLVIQQSLAYV